MDNMVVALLCLTAVVIMFGVAGMAQMLRVQKPIKNSEV